MKNVAVMGSTGSIGTQTLEIIRAHRDELSAVVAEVFVVVVEAVVVTGGSNGINVRLYFSAYVLAGLLYQP